MDGYGRRIGDVRRGARATQDSEAGEWFTWRMRGKGKNVEPAG